MDLCLRVTSPDGTEIAAYKYGTGEPLILIHGVCDDHLSFRRVLPHLGGRFCAYVADRRGRGASGDGPEYDFRREVEDVIALAEAAAAETGAQTGIFAHSFGALLAGEAAQATDAIGRMLLFEPAPPTNDTLVGDLFAKTRAGDADGIIRTLLCGLQRNPTEVFERLRADPDRWPRYARLSPSIARELNAALHYNYDVAALSSRRIPTRFLLGGISGAVMGRYTETAMAAIKGADKVVMEGQAHGAMLTGGKQVSAEINDFF